MNDKDALYQVFQKAVEERKRRNFNTFMDELEGGLIIDLDNAYASGDIEKYNRLLNNIKKQGIRVFRNSEGKHKLKFM